MKRLSDLQPLRRRLAARKSRDQTLFHAVEDVGYRAEPPSHDGGGLSKWVWESLVGGPEGCVGLVTSWAVQTLYTHITMEGIGGHDGERKVEYLNFAASAVLFGAGNYLCLDVKGTRVGRL